MLSVLAGCAPRETSNLVEPLDTAELPNQVELPNPAESDFADGIDVPVLMYHHIGSEPNADTIVTAETFERHLRLISGSGYTAVSIEQLIGYVYNGEPLPEKPVLITFDDGYLSNYEIAYPLLEQYGMKAVIFAIGCSVGRSMYKDTSYEMLAHFSYEQAVEMMASGVIEVQSHTYDLHQWAPYEPEDAVVRSTAGQLEGESEEEYKAVLLRDMSCYAAEYEQRTGRSLYALAYPQGDFSVLTEEIVHEAGIAVTFDDDPKRRNLLIPSEPQTLHAMSRLNIYEDITDEELLCHLSGEEMPENIDE